MADRFYADANLTPKGFKQIADVSSATGIPGGQGRVALIQALNQNVRWRDDGSAPTANVGMRLHAGETILYVGSLKDIKFIEETTSAEVNVTVYE